MGDNLKFIVLLRNPVNRAYSYYWTMKKRGVEKLPFILAILFEKMRTKVLNDKRDFSYIRRGFYSKQLINYFKYFDKKDFKIILYEDFVKDQNKYMNEILQFLGISKEYFFQNKEVFKNTYPPMNVFIRFILQTICFYEYKRLEKLLNTNLKKWK